MRDEYAKGYPPSSPDDLDPESDVIESLEDADRDLEAEDRVSPEGRRPEGSVDDDDAREDAHDVEALADTRSRDHLQGGRGPQDRPNFNDNAAEWSRDQ